MKYPEDFINKIICGDCLEVMKEMPDKCVDLVLTDPPYNVGKEYNKYKDNKTDFKKWISPILNEIFRIAEKVVITPGWKMDVFYCYPIPKHIIIWHKPNGCAWTPLAIHNVWEPILVYNSGKPMLTSDYIYCPISIQAYAKGHPCPKPLKLFNILVKAFTKEGDLVFDPFIGSGTTAESCKLFHRKYIGIDIDPEYCKIVEERLAQGVL